MSAGEQSLRAWFVCSSPRCVKKTYETTRYPTYRGVDYPMELTACYGEGQEDCGLQEERCVCAGGDMRVQRRRSSIPRQRSFPGVERVRPVGVRNKVRKRHGTWKELQVVLNMNTARGAGAITIEIGPKTMRHH